MTQYEINLPRVDSSKNWITIRIFDSKEETVDFCKRVWGIENGMYCMLSYDGKWWNVDTPNPNIQSTTHSFLEIEGFCLKSDALDFVQQAYNADREGMISLISEIG